MLDYFNEISDLHFMFPLWDSWKILAVQQNINAKVYCNIDIRKMLIVIHRIWIIMIY